MSENITMKRERVVKLACHIAVSAIVAYDNALAGNAPNQRRAMERLSSPWFGDLVVEITTFFRTDRPKLDAVGWLLRKTQEKIDFGDPGFVWDEAAEGRPHPTEEVVYIETLDGREFRWTNAKFIAIPGEWPPQ